VQRGDKAASVEAAAAALDADQLVVMPSARWYMLCGRADAEPVTRRMFAGKHRPSDRSLMLAVADRKAAAGMFSFTSAARVLADAFWPGDLALLLPWRDVTGCLPAANMQTASYSQPQAPRIRERNQRR
jgi:tRNA A37 threonylcarbamoyladenosine synthetase subunit TsaC/SUA5/YrdC